eukprot:scaffold2645_cov112-Isochrysis_galbana.AAC.4
MSLVSYSTAVGSSTFSGSLVVWHSSRRLTARGASRNEFHSGATPASLSASSFATTAARSAAVSRSAKRAAEHATRPARWRPMRSELGDVRTSGGGLQAAVSAKTSDAIVKKIRVSI